MNHKDCVLLDTYVQNYKADLNSNASDVIFYGAVFHNVTAQIKSEKLEDVVRPGKRYLLFPDSPKKLRCYHAVYDEEYDLFIITKATFDRIDRKWLPLSTFSISRDFGMYGHFSLPTWMDIDICGQGVMTENGAFNFISGMMEEAEKFFDGKFIVSLASSGSLSVFDMRPLSLSMFPGSSIFSIMSGNTVSDKSLLCDDTMLSNGDGNILICFKDGTRKWMHKDMPLPAGAEKAIKETVQIWKGMYLEKEFRYPQTVSILQNDSGEPALRHFVILRYFHDGELIVEAEEFLRDYFGPKMIHPNSTLIWYDDMSGTVFEYTTGILDEAIKNNGPVPALKQNREFMDTYGIPDTFAAWVAYYTGSDGLLEKLLSGYKGTEAGRNLVSSIILDQNSIEESINGVFGAVDKDKKRLNDMLGLPKGFDEIFKEYNLTNQIAGIKHMFGADDAAKKYLRQMNRDDILYMAVLLSEHRQDNNNLYDTMRDITQVYGVPAWKEALMLLANNLPFWGNAYRYYIKDVKRLKGDGFVDAAALLKRCPWRFPLDGEDMAKSRLFVSKMTRLKKHYAQINEYFQKSQDAWKKYDYSNEKFMVICPSCIMDILDEGMALNHCVADFIGAICEDKTNIVFIRRKCELEKPYFTAEIRNGTLKQVHGFNNSNVDSESLLEQFLMEFCEEKDIGYTDGQDLAGPPA